MSQPGYVFLSLFFGVSPIVDVVMIAKILIWGICVVARLLARRMTVPKLQLRRLPHQDRNQAETKRLLKVILGHIFGFAY